MFGLRTIGSTVSNLFGQKTDNNETLVRSFLSYLSGNGSGGETSFLQPQMNVHGYAAMGGVSDYTINSQDVFQMCSQDSYFSSLVKTAEEQIFVKGGYFDAQKRRLPELKEIYKKYDIEGLLRKIFKYEFAEGGGNWILYPNNRKLVVDPFWAEGSHRASVYGDDDNREVIKVDILSYSRGQTAIRSIPTNQNNRFIKIGRYEDGGSYMFSSNPAKRAVFWWIIKKYIGGANLMCFKNGLQEPFIVDPAYDKLAALAQAFTQGKVMSDGGENVTQNFLGDPLKSFVKNAELTIEMLRQAQGVGNTNKVLYAKTPINITKIGRDNKSMETIALRDVCNQEISFACGIGRGVLDAENAKFNNAEQMKDNLMNFVVKPYQKKFENLLNTVIIPFYSPEFEARGEKYIFGKEIGEEDIEVFKANTERVSTQADIITKIAGTGYELDLDKMELIKVSTPEPATTVSSESTEVKDNEKLVEKKVEAKTEIQEQRNSRAEKKTLIENILEGTKFQKFNLSVEKIFIKQLTSYSEKLSKYENAQDALDNFEKDFKSVSNFGLGVQQAKTQLLMFGRLGVESVENELGKNKRANTDGFDFPMEVLEVIDIQSQILVKGWESLGSNQLEVAKQFFPQLEKTADGSPYKGLDNQTGQQVLNILKDGLQSGIGTKEIANNLAEKIPEISKRRATLITETETSKAFQTARFVEYKSEGAKWKKWSTVRDGRARDPHTQNMNQGWIPFDQAFSSGEMTSGMAPGCRCDVSISLSETKPE